MLNPFLNPILPNFLIKIEILEEMETDMDHLLYLASFVRKHSEKTDSPDYRPDQKRLKKEERKIF